MSTPFYDLASLVVVPSGYKSGKIYAQKPLTTDGQLTFTRASNATRVASNGLIEKVRTNLFTYSEQLDNAAWVKNVTTITANAIVAPDGTTTADKMADSDTTTAARYTYQSPASSGTIYTSSGYFKKGEYNFVTLHAFGLNGAVFNLDTGVKVSQSGGVGSIVSVGNGWYRCSFAFTAGGTSVFFSQSPAGNISYAGTTGSGIYAWGLQVETGDIATNYIATTTAAVSVGPVSGLPRLDYLNSSCPRILLEPQRTNLLTYSEQFDNAAWTKQTGITITANTTETLDPSGYYGADKVVSTNGSTGFFQAGLSLNTTLSYTRTIYLKGAVGGETLKLKDPSGFGPTTNVTLTNSWQRYEHKTTATGDAYQGLWVDDISNGATIYAWGAQLEAGAYATSYIPTLGTSVTRVVDYLNKSGVSSLIGQTEGVAYIDFNREYATGNYDRYFVMDDGNATIYRTGIFILPEPSINGRVYIQIRNNSSDVLNYTYNSTTVPRLKIAVAYKNNDMAIYINGTQVATSSSALTFAHTLTQVFNNYGNNQKINEALVFKTRLTNAQLAELTTL